MFAGTDIVRWTTMITYVNVVSNLSVQMPKFDVTRLYDFHEVLKNSVDDMTTRWFQALGIPTNFARSCRSLNGSEIKNLQLQGPQTFRVLL